MQGTPEQVQVSEIRGPNWVWGVRDSETRLSATPELHINCSDIKNIHVN